MEEPLNPVDSYLLKLNEQKQRVEASLPGLVQGVNNTFGLDVKIPNGIPLNFAGQNAAGANRGMASFTPGINTPGPKINGTVDFVSDMLKSSMIPGAIPHSDAADSVGLVGFGASANKNNFDRYYNHPKFKELAWNPYIDNEAVYNKNATWLDDFSRASSQWGSLAKLGFNQTIGNWDDLFTLNTEGDTKYARDMNKMMSIANSTRGGVGGFGINLYANSAYTFGVIGAAVAEEIALWGATALSGGILGETALLRTASLGKRLVGAGKTALRAEELAKGAKTVEDVSQGINTAINAVDNVGDARKFWNGVANFVTPFGETVDTYKKIKTGADGFDKLSDFAKNSKQFGAFFRDIKMLNMTLAESRLEGGMVENDVFEQLYADHLKKNNGKAPEGKEANDIIAQAKLAGTRTTMANAPAIFFSNKIVFDKMLKGFKPFKDLRGGLGEMVIDFSAVGKPGKKVFQGFVDPSKTFRKMWYNKLYFKNAVNQFKPKTLMKNGLRFATANLTEGLQESYQEGISSAMKNYYLETFASPERAGLGYAMQYLGKGFGDQFSGQGAETFLSGFLMGGLVQGPQTLAFQTAPALVGKGYNKIFDKETYLKNQEREAKKAQEQERITGFLNEVQADPRKFYDKIYENMQSQKDFSNLMNEAETAGDQKEHKDAKNDSIFNHVSTLLENGYIDLFTDQIESFKGLSDNELSQAFGSSATETKDTSNKDVRARLGSVLGKVNQIKGLYDKYSTISNPHNISSSNPDEVMDALGFEFVRKMAIYNEYTFEQNMKRMGDILNDATSSSLGKIQGSALTFLFSQSPLASMGYAFSTVAGDVSKSRLDVEIDQLNDEAKTYAQGSPEQQKLGKQKELLAGQLTQFKADFDAYVKSYTAAKSSALSEEKAAERKQDITLADRIVEGSNVEYTFKKGNKIKGTIVEKKDGKIVIEYEENGKKKRKEISAKSKLLTLLDGPQNKVEEGAEERAIEQDIETRRKNLGDRLREYLSTVSGLPVDSVQFDKMVGHMIDYAELGEDSKVAMTAVNMLNDPAKFSLAATAFSQGKKDAFKIAQVNLNKALEEYKRRMMTNDLLRELFKNFNVFLLPEDIEKLTMEDVYPSAFYETDVKTKEIHPVPANSKKYTDILDFLGKYSEEEGIVLKGRPILQTPLETVIYDAIPVEKAPTIKEILEGLGLKPGSKTYTVTVAEMINFVLSERFGSVPARNILQKLLTMIDPSEKMVISFTERDGFSYKKGVGIVIDPRFATREYSFQNKDGKYVTASMGYLLVNGITQMIVDQNLNDPQFQNAIDDVMEATRAYMEAHPETADKLKLTLDYGLTSREKFMSMALADAAFQSYLARVPYKNQNINLWKQLIRSIAALIKKLFKGAIPITDNALEEVLGIMSNKIAGNEIEAKTKVVTKVQKTGKEGVTINTPLSEIESDYPDLYDKLYVLFDDENRKNNTSRPIEEIEAWFKEGGSAIEDLIASYNTVNNLTVTPEEQARMNQAKETKKSERKIAFINRVEQADEEYLDILEGRIQSLKYLQDNGITSKEAKEVIGKRRAELKRTLPKFETINQSHILIMKDKSKFSNKGIAVVVGGYNSDTGTLFIYDDADTSDDPELIELDEEEYLDQVERVVMVDEFTDEEVEEEDIVEEEEKEVSNQNATEMSDKSGEEEYEEDKSDATRLGKEESKNNLLNNLGCK